MRRLLVSLSFILLVVVGRSQQTAARPDIFFIAIGSRVYDATAGQPSEPFFPEKIDLRPFIRSVQQDTASGDDLRYFVEELPANDSMQGDRYLNRSDHRRPNLWFPFYATRNFVLESGPPAVDTFQRALFPPFDNNDFPGARKSAMLVEQLLRRCGGRGVVITSPDQPVSRAMFFAGIDSLWTLIRQAHSAHPLIVFYYCGHGYGDSFGRRFLVPGTFAGQLGEMPIDTRRLRSVFVKDLYNYLRLPAYPFIMLLDCCSEDRGPVPGDKKEAYDKQQITVAEDWDTGFYHLPFEDAFQPRGPYPVISSSKLGNNSVPVEDPTDSGSVVYIGPICRRLHLAARQFPDLFRSLMDIQTTLMDKELDPSTVTLGIYCRNCPEEDLPAKTKP